MCLFQNKNLREGFDGNDQLKLIALCTSVVRVCIWFFFVPGSKDPHQLTVQQYLIGVDATRIYLEFFSVFGSL